MKQSNKFNYGGTSDKVNLYKINIIAKCVLIIVQIFYFIDHHESNLGPKLKEMRENLLRLNFGALF